MWRGFARRNANCASWNVVTRLCNRRAAGLARIASQLGLPTSKLIALGIAAPLLNPFSLMFGLTALSLTQYLIMLVVTGIVAIIVFDISSRFAVRDQVTAVSRPDGLTGGTRLRNLLIGCGRLVTGRVMIDLMITIAISALTLSLIRSGAFLVLCESSNRSGPVVTSLLTLTQYVSPARAIIQFAGIRDAYLATATGLAIYVFGTGFGGASIVAFCQWYGWRRMLALAIALFVVVGTISYALSYALPVPVGEVAETTVVVNLSRPTYASFSNINRAFSEAMVFANSFMYASSAAFVMLILAGLYIRIAKIDFHSDDADAALQENAGRMSKAIPASQLGAVSVCGIGIVFFLSAYIFFPSPSEVIVEMERAEIDASLGLLKGDSDLAKNQITIWDSAAAKIPIGAAIRGSFPSPSQRKLVINLRTKLRNTKELLLDGNLSSARAQRTDLKRLLSELKVNFAGEDE